MQRFARAPSKYVLLLGQGRSGTNWLLDLLDLSSLTYCRSEPNELSGSDFARLPSGATANPNALAEDFGELWDAAVAAASTRMGRRDHRLRVPKAYLRLAGISRGLDWIIKGRRLRSLLGKVEPEFLREEFAVPFWYSSHDALTGAVPVLKLNAVPAWAAWVFEHRPGARSLHILRHPGGVLNSWKNRWLRGKDPERVRSENAARLVTIAQHSPDWARRFGDIAAMREDESELWFWLYAAEVIDAAGSARSDRYVCIVYEELVQDPVAIVRRAFELCGLPFTDDVARRIVQTTRHSPKIAGAWHDKLDRNDVALVEKILDGSPLCALWNAGSVPTR